MMKNAPPYQVSGGELSSCHCAGGSALWHPTGPFGLRFVETTRPGSNDARYYRAPVLPGSYKHPTTLSEIRSRFFGDPTIKAVETTMTTYACYAIVAFAMLTVRNEIRRRCSFC